MKMPTVEELFKVGAHFGHLKGRSHPKIKDYIYSVRNQIMIINLDLTLQTIERATKYLTLSAQSGKTFLIVGTKKQAKEIVEKIAKANGISYITSKWLGGTLTNFTTIKSSLKKMESLDDEVAKPEFLEKSKKYQSSVNQKLARLHKTFDGLINLAKLPDIIIIVDIAKEKTAVLEARSLEIPLVGIVDTNGNPELVDYPIVLNDDSTRSIELVVDLIGSALAEGKSNQPKVRIESKKED